MVLSSAILSLVLAGPAAAQDSPLKRRYREGEVLNYEIAGSHSMQGKITSTYEAHAEAAVVKGADGVFHEEIRWTPGGGKERQRLSLDPGFKSAIPNLSKFAPALYGPITDLMTFYVDEQLAIKRGLQKPGDHVYVSYGKPSSWAAGGKVVVGYDCIDFDAALIAVDAAAGLATVVVSHVPPAKGCESVPAEWMRKPVSDTANNWFQIEKTGKARYEAGAGKEVFNALLKIRLPSGVIESATLDNPVELEQRICKDAKLVDCSDSERVRILRKISLSLKKP